MRVLDYLRLRGPMSRSDLHHRGHIENSKTRDKLVERFEAENLIRVDGRNLKATTYGEFVESLYAREKLPQPEDFWRKATGRSTFED
jgi:coproporphyrinogen III oxidase-like Fe-S oxidoreductase